jgi:hypothetical protein
MGEPRPTSPQPTQDEQAAHLRETGNGPTTPGETELLAEEFGEPHEGVYGAPAHDQEGTTA